MADQCLICDYDLQTPPTNIPARDATGYSCANCGDFILTRTAVRKLGARIKNNPEEAALLSYSIRKMQRPDVTPELDSLNFENILKNSELPNPAEQANNLIIWLGENLNEVGEIINIELQNFQAVIGAKSPIGVSFIIKSLWTRGILEGIEEESLGTPFTLSRATLSFEGWQYYEELMRGITDSRKAFMAMEYGDPGLDEIVDNYFRPAVRLAGFELIRLDDPDKQKAGLIDDRLRVEIRTSRFLIADLTHDNEGAYWEAGFAEGLGKPVIYTCEKEKFKEMKTHFDTNHHLTIIWNKDNPDDAARELKATIRATLPDEAKLLDN